MFVKPANGLWNCDEKGHIFSKCPKKNTDRPGNTEGGNRAQENEKTDVFDISVLEMQRPRLPDG